MIITPFASQRNSDTIADRLGRLVLGRASGMLYPRWLFLRGLGLIFFSAFYSLAFQAHGLVGEHGILPAASYLRMLGSAVGAPKSWWFAPSVFWLGAGDGAITAAIAGGLVCSILLTLNVAPRWMAALCTLLFLSFVATLQDFSAYQSDGMLLQAGCIAIFFAPRGLRPGIGATHPPSSLSLILLRWEWFCIYFESGVVKLASGDPEWRHLTAMDEYYQNGPLPAWPGWYVQHLPHWYHAATAAVTLTIELAVVWAVFLPRRWRRLCAVLVTALQIGIIATANYAFLNYLVLILGVLLLDDQAVREGTVRIRMWMGRAAGHGGGRGVRQPERAPDEALPDVRAGRVLAALPLLWIFYATLWAFLASGSESPLAAPEHALEPFRIANAYGLFANMTPARYEIEFQGSNDGGRTWIAYPFRYKPQDPYERPGIYAPYQPRFDWNLWFASLAPWQQSTWVIEAQARLLEGSRDVLALFRSDPFHGHPPAEVRTVLWQYWFTDAATKRATGAWWRRQALGIFAGVVDRDATGRIVFDPAGT